jgi:hypothetical protein
MASRFFKISLSLRQGRESASRQSNQSDRQNPKLISIKLARLHSYIKPLTKLSSTEHDNMLTAQMPLDATPPLRWYARRSKQPRILRHIQSFPPNRIGVEYALMKIMDEAEGRVDESGRSGELRVSSWGDVGSKEVKRNNQDEIWFSDLRFSRDMDEKPTIRRRTGSVCERVVEFARRQINILSSGTWRTDDSPSSKPHSPGTADNSHLPFHPISAPRTVPFRTK